MEQVQSHNPGEHYGHGDRPGLLPALVLGRPECRDGRIARRRSPGTLADTHTHSHTSLLGRKERGSESGDNDGDCTYEPELFTDVSRGVLRMEVDAWLYGVPIPLPFFFLSLSFSLSLSVSPTNMHAFACHSLAYRAHTGDFRGPSILLLC